MGLSRNKVAVSEGAAGSPPFYGDTDMLSRACRIVSRQTKDGRERDARAEEILAQVLFNFQGLNSEKQITLYGGVAQLGEHLPCKQGVMGSIPIISTKMTRTLKPGAITVCSSGG